MCGIGGIVDKQNRPVDEERLRNMLEKVAHRGPDGMGFFFEKQFGLGHRRLSIIDLSDSGRQPMSYDNGNYQITYNGEVFNYIELKAELEKAGFHFSNATDTEVILAAYQHWGAECLNKFNGMLAFCIYDKRKNQLFCARDRFGIKPFYYFNGKKEFVFGSEIRQLLDFLPARTANKRKLINFLASALDEPLNETFFDNIYELPPAHYMIYDLSLHRYRIKQYYQMNIDPKLERESMEEAVLRYEECLKHAIAIRLRSDVKVGTCLSGGVDSSAIASIAGKAYNAENSNRFKAITAKSVEKATDETYFARMVAESADLDLFITEPKHDDVLSDIETLIKVQEEPFDGPSIYMQYKVFEIARQTGCVVMLDGQGGDETMLGYERYYIPYLFGLSPFKIPRAFFNIISNSRLNYKELISYFFYFSMPGLRLRYLLKRSSYIRKPYLDLVSREAILTLAKSYRNLRHLQINEIKRFQLRTLLRWEDKNSMAHSIEARLPFLDYRLVELSLSMNIRHKINNGYTKYVLRKVLEKHCNKEIAWRTHKLGFQAPTKTWSVELGPEMRQCVLSSSLLKKITKEGFLEKSFDTLEDKMKWRLYIIAKWEKTFELTLTNE